MLALLATLMLAVGAAAAGEVVVLTVRGVINPAMAGYLQRGIGEAERAGAAAVVIQLDTPGGLDSSTREIMQTIIAARVPVVVYVSPSGGRAASAGLFIAQAAHVAAMAPNTTIGSAHPVQLGGGPGGGQGEKDPELARKIENDAVSMLRSVAERRGRNVEWVERAVRESVNVHDREAVELKVVDLGAPNLPTLLERIDGRSVALGDGRAATLRTAGAATRAAEMSLAEQIMHALTDPNLAYILLTVGMYGLIYELANPSAWIPGIAGLVCIVVGLYALGTLGASFAGIALILLAFALFLAEIAVSSSHGALVTAGAICFALGSLLLYNSGGPGVTLSPAVALPAVLVTAAFAYVIVQAAWRSRHLPLVTGGEGLLGAVAVASTDLALEGMVRVHGELWRAVAETPVRQGDSVQIVARDNLTLRVRPTAGASMPS